jgi:hypothetical protein
MAPKKSKRSGTQSKKKRSTKVLVPAKELYPHPMPVYSGWPFPPKMGKWAHDKPMPTGPVEMMTHDNGGRAFRTVFVPNKYIYVAARTDSDGDDSEDERTGVPVKERYSHEVLFLPWNKFERFFPGSSANNRAENPTDVFGTQLIHVGGQKYIMVGIEVYEFTVPKGDVIIDFYAERGNSDVMYNFAVGQKYVYVFDSDWDGVVGFYVDINVLTEEFIEHIRALFKSRKLLDKSRQNMLSEAVMPRTISEFTARSYSKTAEVQPYLFLSYQVSWAPSPKFRELAAFLHQQLTRPFKASRRLAERPGFKNKYPYSPKHRVLPEDASNSVVALELYYTRQ